MAAGDILIVEQARVVFGAAAGDDIAWDTDRGILDGTGQQSAQLDLRVGASDTNPRPNLFRVRAYAQCQATPTLGQSIDIYFKTWDDAAAHGDNDLSASDLPYDATQADNKTRNLHYVGSIIVDDDSANTEFVMSVAEYPINARYIQSVLVNRSGATLTTNDTDTKLELTPIVYQGQSS